MVDILLAAVVVIGCCALIEVQLVRRARRKAINEYVPRQREYEYREPELKALAAQRAAEGRLHNEAYWAQVRG